MKRSIQHFFFASLAILAGMSTIGCSDGEPEFTEVKDLKDDLTIEELRTFFRIINALPEKKLPEMPSVFAPTPEWNRSRTLPVKELVNSEFESVVALWDVDSRAEKLEKNRQLARALRNEKMTSQQFIGLVLTIGTTLSRNTLHEDQSLDDVIERGEQEIAELRSDARTFSMLSEAGQYAVVEKATWITRTERARRLKLVPESNRRLVAKHAEKLSVVFPVWFIENPLDAVPDLRQEYGLPFEELPESGLDEHIEWTREDALIGRDKPTGL